jgi:EpsI family protein
MINRRNLAVAAACLLGAGAAYALAPHRRLSLLGAQKLAAIIPEKVGDKTGAGEWVARDVAGLVSASTTDSLSNDLYDEVIERAYRQAASGDEIMMLIAHGPSQTHDLQLHRPEICYPAFGYDIRSSTAIQIPLGDGATLPARALTAEGADHKEYIVYWTRLGEFLPVTHREQSDDRLKTALEGYVGDGVLCRFSIVGGDPDPAFTRLKAFITAFVENVAPNAKAALIGTKLANRLSARPA